MREGDRAIPPISAVETAFEIPLLSEEGWPEGPGWFQSDNPEDWQLRNHPSRDALRDPAALLTQEGILGVPH
jgi:hypothetical protein